jgi:predicted nucleic acid-binding protein
MIVVDASLAVKWFFDEVDSETAANVLEQWAGRLAAPDVMAIEVASALVRQANSVKPETLETAAALDKWAIILSQPTIKFHRTTPESLREAAQLAMELGHPFKDCLYLALAIELDCDFVTCDARFAAKAAEMFPRTTLLQDFQT